MGPWQQFTMAPTHAMISPRGERHADTMDAIKDTPIRVLIVEDNAGDARLVEIMLTEREDGAFEVARAQRLEEALGIIAEGNTDVVLLDLGLPDSAGLETATRAVEAAPHMPIVVLTGLDDENTGMEAVRRGVQDYLVKGQIEGPLVRRAVRYAIDRHQAGLVLLRQLSFQQQMIDALPTPVFYTDTTLAIVGCNTAFEEMVGVQRFEMLGGHVFEVLPEGLANAFGESDLGDPGVSREATATVLGTDGNEAEICIKVTAFADPDGGIGGLVVCVCSE